MAAASSGYFGRGSFVKPVHFVVTAIALLVLPLLGYGVWTALSQRQQVAGGSAVDSQARIEIENLNQQILGLQEQLVALSNQIDSLGIDQAALPEDVPSSAENPAADTQSAISRDGENRIAGDYATVVLIANRRNVNKGQTVGSSAFLEGFLGRPRKVLTDDCEGMDNPKLQAMLVVDTVGPVKVQMLRPAVESLTRVFEKVRAVDQDLYDRINTSGSLCVRRIRGTTDLTSTHSFGLAIDLNIDGHLDGFADGRTQLGLTILADFFHEEGWVWGAGFSREDSMHFEVSRATLEAWRAAGKI
ncbi:M15 family metallopeptidase [Paracoccus broussonetiae]|uniref:M15 family metallopeptidase n=1 Tax=Paracoccus broussonetiae TaxID=3075834 RepID=UPI00288A9121|nr:M15 family metallopeptidase [Paracoccus sp. CPCC 101403]